MQKLIEELSLGHVDCAKCLSSLIEVDPFEGEKALLYLKKIRHQLTVDSIWMVYNFDCEMDSTKFLLMILNKEGIFSET